MTDESSATAASKRRNSALRFFAIDDIAECLDVSMRGDGPAYIQLGRAVRYTETALLQWMKSNTRTSTSQAL